MKRRPSVLRLFGFLLAAFVAIILLQAICAPWGRSLTGGATLTGRWLGQIPRPDGPPRPVYISIEGLIWGADDSGCLRNCDVQGLVRVCASPGLIQDYTFGGDVNGRRASTFSMDVRKEKDAAYGWKLSDLKGEWSGGDAVRLAGEWITDPPHREVRIVTDSNGNTVMDPPPEPQRRSPVVFTLGRGREKDFIAACK